MADRDELHPIIHRAPQSVYIELAARVVRNDLHLNLVVLDRLQIGDVVALVFTDGGEDPVTGLKWNPVKSHVPRPRGVFDERDLVPLTVEQTSEGIVGTL